MKDFDVASRHESDEPSCAICLSHPTNMSYIDGCSHRFCFKCISRWARKQTSCPVCRRPFSTVTDRRRKIKRFERKISEPVRRPVRNVGVVHFLPMVVYTGVCIVPLPPVLSDGYLRMFSASTTQQFLP